MALTYTEAESVSKSYFDKTFKQQVYQDSPFWVKLQKSNKILLDGGYDIRFPIRWDELGYADAVDSTAAVVFETKETRNMGVLDWKYYTTKNLITCDELPLLL